MPAAGADARLSDVARVVATLRSSGCRFTAGVGGATSALDAVVAAESPCGSAPVAGVREAGVAAGRRAGWGLATAKGIVASVAIRVAARAAASADLAIGVGDSADGSVVAAAGSSLRAT